VEPAGSPRDLDYRHGFRVGTGPVHVPGHVAAVRPRMLLDFPSLHSSIPPLFITPTSKVYVRHARV
jgi:hypothetical protein